jgi:hypothetical protein
MEQERNREKSELLEPGTQRLNGILEDVGAELGFTATSALAAWFGGMNLYVPGTVDPDHPIVSVIGIAPYRRLVAAFGGEVLCLPEGRQDEIDRRDRVIATMLGGGKGTKEIAGKTGLSERRVQQIRMRLENSGVIPLIWNGGRKRYQICEEENRGHNFGGKTG